jgi:hypothetical protein
MANSELTSVKADRDLIARLKILAAERSRKAARRITLQDVLAEAMREYLKRAK